MVQIDEATTVTLTTPPSSNCNENLIGILSFCVLKKQIKKCQRQNGKHQLHTAHTQHEKLYTIYDTDFQMILENSFGNFFCSQFSTIKEWNATSKRVRIALKS